MAGRRRGPGHRLFVALEPPAALREELAAWARAQRRVVPGLRPVPAENLHVTLAFLGERPGADIDPVLDALALVAGSGGQPVRGVTIGAPLWLPPRRPRALATEVRDDAGGVLALQQAIAERLLAAVGWSEERAFRPHLTLARMRPDAVPGRRELPATPSLRFDADALILFRSFLGPAGARHTPLERVVLR